MHTESSDDLKGFEGSLCVRLDAVRKCDTTVTITEHRYHRYRVQETPLPKPIRSIRQSCPETFTVAEVGRHLCRQFGESTVYMCGHVSWKGKEGGELSWGQERETEEKLGIASSHPGRQTDRPASQLASQSINKSINKSINQSINRSVSQSVSQPSIHPSSQPASQPVSQPVSQYGRTCKSIITCSR